MNRMTLAALTVGLLVIPADHQRTQASMLAQETTSIPLRFEIVTNGANVATFEASVASGSAGGIEVNGLSKLTFTPTTPSPDTVAIAFSLNSSGQVVRPRVLLRGGSGSISLKSASGDSIEVRVSSAPQ